MYFHVYIRKRVDKNFANFDLWSKNVNQSETKKIVKNITNNAARSHRMGIGPFPSDFSLFPRRKWERNALIENNSESSKSTKNKILKFVYNIISADENIYELIPRKYKKYVAKIGILNYSDNLHATNNFRLIIYIYYIFL